MQNRLFLLCFCFLLSACVQGIEPSRDVYAQSELLPPKQTNIKTEQQTYQSATPPIVVPQQTVLPAHILSTPNTIPVPQQATNPTPFVQTIVIPQAAPYAGYQPPVNIQPQTNPNYVQPIAQSYPQQQMPINNYPVQNINTPVQQPTVWQAPQQNVQTNVPDVSINELVEKNNSNINIPRW